MALFVPKFQSTKPTATTTTDKGIRNSFTSCHNDRLYLGWIFLRSNIFSKLPSDIHYYCYNFINESQIIINLQNICKQNESISDFIYALIISSLSMIKLKSVSYQNEIYYPNKKFTSAPVDYLFPYKSSCSVYKQYDAMLNHINFTTNTNKFYKLQLLKSNSNTNNTFYCWIRFGRVGSDGQTKLIKDIKNKCVSEFKKRFQDKTGNNWEDRDAFIQHHSKYVYIPMSSVATDVIYPVDNELVEYNLDCNVSRFNSKGISLKYNNRINNISDLMESFQIINKFLKTNKPNKLFIMKDVTDLINIKNKNMNDNDMKVNDNNVNDINNNCLFTNDINESLLRNVILNIGVDYSLIIIKNDLNNNININDNNVKYDTQSNIALYQYETVVWKNRVNLLELLIGIIKIKSLKWKNDDKYEFIHDMSELINHTIKQITLYVDINRP